MAAYDIERSPTIRQAAILTGGLGTRLGNLTASTPKSLLPCGDRPFLAWILRELCRYGVEEVILLTGHLASAIETMLPTIISGLPKTLRVTCVREERPAGTGGALHNARNYLAERFLLCNGDSWLDFNLGHLLADAASDSHDTIGRMALHNIGDASRYGVVQTQEDCVTAFQARANAGGPGTINAGLYLFDRRILELVTPFSSLERDVLPVLASRNALRGTRGNGYFIDIGIPTDLEQAQIHLPNRLLRRALFLDRDGVINLDEGWVGTRDRFTFVPGALAAIRTASDLGWHVFVVTNQSGIANGLYDEREFTSLCSWMTDVIRSNGGTIDDLRYCPFHPEARLERYRFESDWRKPKPGMLLDLIAHWQIDPARCLLIGDKKTDLLAADAAGIAAHLFPTDGNLADFVAPLLRN